MMSWCDWCDWNYSKLVDNVLTDESAPVQCDNDK